MNDARLSADSTGPSADRSETISLFCWTFAVVLATRLPFIGAGYGVDPDAFRVAAAARHMAATHTYTASRFPGYPVQEIISALLSGGGPLALNGATAVMSAVGFAFFALTLRRLGQRAPFAASLAAALVPVVYINSVEAMDYLWALGFLLAALYFLVARRLTVAGALAGFAIGSRITSGAILAPFALYLLLETEGALKVRFARILQLGVTACVVGLLCYSPVLHRYGLGALVHESNHLGLVEALKVASLDTWGLVGTIALGVGVVLAVVRRDPTTELRPLAPWLAVVGVYLALFAVFPNEAGYLIPIVPFVVLLLGVLLSPRQFLGVVTGLAVSSFVFGIGREGIPGAPSPSGLAVSFHVDGRSVVLDPLKGPILAAHSARTEAERYVARVRTQGSSLPANSVLLVGYWWPQIEDIFPEGAPDRERYVEQIRGRDAARYGRESGISIYYLQRQRDYNIAVGGVDVGALGARELPAE